mmetsp:Transcript_48771/g.72451  ORF Transcript_48771/g.72451 Transcript_48771/m.72451 type:complete len:962 (-) Transcript_48771:557-3442(-)|eukprot:CAMPEP_0195521110 /NCGR_PEP_ID=MMETSP0794_2-20130614/17978_1 /TAXON_ID=515487 /ORGANISM="Stephanopyxis turris, Strain CCMP 815" /LENGTH=961 /DNA_ID=CAMNT_0040650583 /DNA_START=388 /DNA_END=3273 /DNA_ORIENTATION=+
MATAAPPPQTDSDWLLDVNSSASVLPTGDFSTSDLFVGDLFGDELIDMYSSTSLPTEDMPSGLGNQEELDTKNGAPGINSGGEPCAITAPPTISTTDEVVSAADVITSKTRKDNSNTNGETQPAAMDDLGAFRSNTSFNDFPTVLPSAKSGEAVAAAAAALEAASNAANVAAPTVSTSTPTITSSQTEVATMLPISPAAAGTKRTKPSAPVDAMKSSPVTATMAPIAMSTLTSRLRSGLPVTLSADLVANKKRRTNASAKKNASAARKAAAAEAVAAFAPLAAGQVAKISRQTSQTTEREIAAIRERLNSQTPNPLGSGGASATVPVATVTPTISITKPGNASQGALTALPRPTTPPSAGNDDLTHIFHQPKPNSPSTLVAPALVSPGGNTVVPSVSAIVHAMNAPSVPTVETSSTADSATLPALPPTHAPTVPHNFAPAAAPQPPTPTQFAPHPPIPLTAPQPPVTQPPAGQPLVPQPHVPAPSASQPFIQQPSAPQTSSQQSCVQQPSIQQPALSVPIHTSPSSVPSVTLPVQSHANTQPTTVTSAQTDQPNLDIAKPAEVASIENVHSSDDDMIHHQTVQSKTPGSASNTSTAHVAVLTSSNWVSACSPNLNMVTSVPPGAITSANASASAAFAAQAVAASKRRRQNLTPDERAKQNRDRNREHARNTRLRKKAYVEELKKTLTEIVAQRDAAELEKKHAVQRDAEQREVRFRVIEEFLKLRGSNEPNQQHWNAILDSNFTFTLPVTNYRGMVKSNSNSAQSPDGSRSHEQVLHGADVMADAALFAAMLETIGRGTVDWTNNVMSGNKVCFQYGCDRRFFIMDGCTGILNWTATTIGAVKQGAGAELTLKGNLRAVFVPATNKLLSLEMLFDTGAISAQLKHISPMSHGEDDSTIHRIQAAETADALLDSLGMTNFNSIASHVDGNVTSSEKSESSDENDAEAGSERGVTTKKRSLKH